jgi:hypothetical protein
MPTVYPSAALPPRSVPSSQFDLLRHPVDAARLAASPPSQLPGRPCPSLPSLPRQDRGGKHALGDVEKGAPGQGVQVHATPSRWPGKVAALASDGPALPGWAQPPEEAHKPLELVPAAPWLHQVGAVLLALCCCSATAMAVMRGG